jgi:3-hydroxyethyl bacteriochlorophyllide a dehydrogenase
MEAVAVIVEKPEALKLSRLPITPAGSGDLVVEIDWSGISTGTERLLWSGRMPHFPGMGYPLVPGYESVGHVLEAPEVSDFAAGDPVFVPGASCFGEVRGLFGGAASHLVVPEARVAPIGADLGERAVLLALAATARNAIAQTHATPPDLIVGHGVLGRLLARLALLMHGPAPVVWETNPARAKGAEGYAVVDPKDDDRHDYRAIYDVSGDASLLDSLIARLAPGGEIVLAGFYSQPLSFAFPPAFMRRARLRVAAEWRPDDLQAVTRLIDQGLLSLDGLITHSAGANQAADAYRTAFEDPACLKMVLDWRACS